MHVTDARASERAWRTALAWRTATKSSGSDCVEVARAPADMIAVRDSKDRDGPVLRYTAAEWDAFLDGVKRGEFDDLLPGAPAGP